MLLTLNFVNSCPLLISLLVFLRQHCFFIHFDIFGLFFFIIKWIDEDLILQEEIPLECSLENATVGMSESSVGAICDSRH